MHLYYMSIAYWFKMVLGLGGNQGGGGPWVLGRTLLVSARFARAWGGGEGGGWGKGLFQKVWFFNYFRNNKSEPDLKDDCIFAVFLNFLPNRFRLNMEPHELVWKSVTAILHIISVSIFKMFFKL